MTDAPGRDGWLPPPEPLGDTSGNVSVVPERSMSRDALELGVVPTPASEATAPTAAATTPAITPAVSYSQEGMLVLISSAFSEEVGGLHKAREERDAQAGEVQLVIAFFICLIAVAIAHVSPRGSGGGTHPSRPGASVTGGGAYCGDCSCGDWWRLDDCVISSSARHSFDERIASLGPHRDAGRVTDYLP